MVVRRKLSRKEEAHGPDRGLPFASLAMWRRALDFDEKAIQVMSNIDGFRKALLIHVQSFPTRP
jgi:hypothetical protein